MRGRVIRPSRRQQEPTPQKQIVLTRYVSQRASCRGLVPSSDAPLHYLSLPNKRRSYPTLSLGKRWQSFLPALFPGYTFSHFSRIPSAALLLSVAPRFGRVARDSRKFNSADGQQHCDMTAGFFSIGVWTLTRNKQKCLVLYNERKRNTGNI